ncbi:MAG: site-2 protease family protein [Bryobacterales bacterium]|nr:site-2 protease family protein [Bryobacterales bacterium]
MTDIATSETAGETATQALAPGSVVRRRPRLWLHVTLFLATIASTTLWHSLLYSACLMGILTAHEFGHYFAARRYRVAVSLPYFIPMPLSMIGTMGAVIRMSRWIPNRRALFDISAAGPLAGVVLAIPVSFVGLMLSTHQPIGGESSGIPLGEPLLFELFERILFGAPSDGTVLLLHDVAFAGWVGLFVTGLNLLPMSQLDGGHISYAVFGKRSELVGWTVFCVLLAVCLTISYQYALFLVLMLFMRIRHAPTLDDAVPLGRSRKVIALALVVVFALSFVPIPISVAE